MDQTGQLTADHSHLELFSVDAGATWKRISIGIGFEGYSWAIHSLASDLPEVLSHYQYAAH